MPTRIALVLGIRPDIIRAARIIKLLDQDESIDLKFIWSGQHYSENLKDVFFKELRVRKPDYELNASGETDAELVGEIIGKLYGVLSEIKPKASIFLGDTNTVMGCIAAAQLNIPIIHIEGCMRSYDWRMPEEKYRTVTDHLSDVIYAYLPQYRENGLLEGIEPHRIVETQNPIVDIIKKEYRPSDVSDYYRKYSITKDGFILMTCHRRENVEHPEHLREILKLCGAVGRTVLFPASYRTQKSILKFGIPVPQNVKMMDPIGYRDFLTLLRECRYVLTDSGTVVEESCILGVPSIQMRTSTERPEVYEAGASVRFDPSEGHTKEDISIRVQKAESLIGQKWAQPFGDGNASERIAKDIIKRAKTNEFETHWFDRMGKNVKRSLMGERNGKK